MKFKILLFLFLAQCFLFSQDNDALKYFPHKTGDLWEYFYSDGPMYTDTLQNLNIKDSTDSEGNIYLTQSAWRINPTQSPILLNSLETYKIDTANNFVFGAIEQNNNALLYKLNANLGDKWVIFDYQGNGFEMVRVDEIKEITLFGYTTILKSFVFYFTSDSTDTTGLDRNIDYLAKGFGLIYRGGGDLVGNIYLTGAVIDRILYGDTTDIITSIIDPSPILPNKFKLFQNYPNPFNPTTSIKFILSELSDVSLKVYNILGKEVKVLLIEELPRGIYSIQWNGKDNDGNILSNGTYLIRMLAGSHKKIIKTVLLK
ncbi:MAG: hypothetical protein COW08_09025 [Ignavibacteriales bacterium CG12_big_fil_rev_8_21_14_0_65_30_8]|nr:MAG: hypothetical protein COW08_09025 [Ignavibacteriales bacterium CG12_big_fil_rev_8_21_14_0_65_30_8]